MSYECQIVVDFEFNPVKKEFRELIKDEIIEIGAVKLNPQYEEIGRFSCLVKPELSDGVSPTITKLTGIRTADLEEAVDFETAIGLFSTWAGPASCRVISWSDNDLRQLSKECWIKSVPFPANLYRWMDFQKVWQRIIHYPHNLCMSLKYAAECAGVEFDDSHAHRALYDSEVTAEILKLTKDEAYLKNLARAKTHVVTEVKHSSYSIGSVCGNKLAELMARLECA